MIDFILPAPPAAITIASAIFWLLLMVFSFNQSNKTEGILHAFGFANLNMIVTILRVSA